MVLDSQFPRFADEEDDGPRWQSFANALVHSVEVTTSACALRCQCESVIEVMLGAQLQALIELNGDKRLTLEPQFKLGQYRFDFALKIEKKPVIVIECDGADFHSSEEQIANDRRKDMAAWNAGLLLLRFTGSEINRHAEKCAIAALNKLIQRSQK